MKVLKGYNEFDRVVLEVALCDERNLKVSRPFIILCMRCWGPRVMSWECQTRELRQMLQMQCCSLDAVKEMKEDSMSGRIVKFQIG